MADQAGLPAGPIRPAFWLVPVNKNAERATREPKNQHLKSPCENGKWELYVSFEDPYKQAITVGRGNTDIYLPEPRGSSGEISKHHCSFVNNPARGAVLLIDHSNKGYTEPYSPNQFELTISFPKESRSILLARGINSHVAFGKDRYYEFQIVWESDGLYDFPNKNDPYSVGPPSHRRKRYLKGDWLGGGAYGTVWRALDVNSGELIAVKSFHHLKGKNLEFAKREVENLVKINQSKIRHDHIIEILGYFGGKPEDTFLEIMMPLKEGNLKTLVEAKPTVDFSHVVLIQMLKALECLAKHKVVHRDVKPENILYELSGDDKYHFRLGDFGLSHDQTLAKTVAGTEPFMAPEVLNKQPQTEKVDIWSLFATIVWLQNIEDFRRRCSLMAVPSIHQWLADLSKIESLRDIGGMGKLKPSHRPTAKDLLKYLSKLRAPSYTTADELADSFQQGLVLEDEEEVDPGGPSHPIGPCPPGPSPRNYDDNDEDDDPGAYMQIPAYNPYHPPIDDSQPIDDCAPGPSRRDHDDNDEDDDQATYLQMPHYEPYSPHLDHLGQYEIDQYGMGQYGMGQYPMGQGYGLPPIGAQPRAGPPPPGFPARGDGRAQEHWVKTYEPAYGPPDGSTADTEIPTNPTTRPLPTRDLQSQSTANTDRKGKGKKHRKN